MKLLHLKFLRLVQACFAMSILFLSMAKANEKESGVNRSTGFSAQADAAARQLISELGSQQTFARLGWQQNPDYKPAEMCFEFWHGKGKTGLTAAQITDCDTHAQDLSRLYASYGTDANPIIFKSRHYWSEKEKFDLDFPQLVESWKAAGGSEDNASFLAHPVCAATLQVNWSGSDYFYDGREHPLCRLYKLEALEAKKG